MLKDESQPFTYFHKGRELGTGKTEMVILPPNREKLQTLLIITPALHMLKAGQIVATRV